MRLSNEQLAQYNASGFISLPHLINSDDISVLMAEAKLLCEIDAPERIIEKNGYPNSIYITSKHRYLFNLSFLPQLVNPAQQILESDVYVHQSKLNPKVAFHGSVVEWHQDFSFWHNLDGMPTDNAVTAVILLQDVDEFNAPLLLVPNSHLLNAENVNLCAEEEGSQENIATSGHSWKDATVSGNSTVIGELKYSVKKSLISESITSFKGTAGSVLFFHSNLIHGSTHNISSRDRYLCFVTYNCTSNALLDIDNPRPRFIANRDFSPISSLPKDSLLSNTI